MPEFLTIPEIISAAKANLPYEVWDFGAGGAETETTLRRNRLAMEQYALCQRVLVDVRERATTTTFLGNQLSLPVMLAPVGAVNRFHPDGSLAVARVAERKGTIAFISTVSPPLLEETAAAVSSPLVFQLYSYGSRDWVKGIVRRVERAGYCALCVTVDLAKYGRRERDLHNRFIGRGSSSDRPNLADLSPEAIASGNFQAGLTWDYIDWLRDLTALPLMVKGIMMPEDAALAVEHGVDVVYVSNHGGRQLDHGLSTIEVLPEVAKAVAGRAEILIDGGFVRGTDVMKGLALGAKAVLIGKLQCWGLGADGETGLERVLDLLTTELDTVMALTGVRHLDEVGPHLVRPTMPLRPSSLPEGERYQTSPLPLGEG